MQNVVGEGFYPLPQFVQTIRAGTDTRPCAISDGLINPCRGWRINALKNNRRVLRHLGAVPCPLVVFPCSPQVTEGIVIVTIPPVFACGKATRPYQGQAYNKILSF